MTALAGGRRRWRSASPRARRLLVVAAVVAGAFALGYLVTLVVFRGGVREIVAVPDLREHTVEDAARILRELGLGIELGPAIPHPDVAPGAIIAQSPLPGQEVAPGSVVRVNPSAGPDQVRVPDVTPFPAEQARQMLERAGFRVELVERPDVRRAGQLIDVAPRPGELVTAGSVLTLVVSAGPPLVEVPQVVGLDRADADAVLELAGLRIGGVEYELFSVEPIGRVVAQWPAPGDSARAGTTVELIVSGAPPPPAPEEEET